MFLLIFFFLTFSFEKNLNADEIQFADSHGPITVMGDHLHKKNELMLSLRLSKMNMEYLCFIHRIMKFINMSCS